MVPKDCITNKRGLLHYTSWANSFSPRDVCAQQYTRPVRHRRRKTKMLLLHIETSKEDEEEKKKERARIIMCVSVYKRERERKRERGSNPLWTLHHDRASHLPTRCDITFSQPMSSRVCGAWRARKVSDPSFEKRDTDPKNSSYAPPAVRFLPFLFLFISLLVRFQYGFNDEFVLRFHHGRWLLQNKPWWRTCHLSRAQFPVGVLCINRETARRCVILEKRRDGSHLTTVHKKKKKGRHHPSIYNSKWMQVTFPGISLSKKNKKRRESLGIYYFSSFNQDVVSIKLADNSFSGEKSKSIK